MLAIQSTLKAAVGLKVLLRLPQGCGKVQIEIQGVSFPGGETDAA